MGKIKTISPEGNDFLSVITQLHDAPSELFYRGALPANRPPCVAVVGSRNPTDYGKEVTYRLAYDLAKAGVCVVSGLALGIDAISHRAALDAGGTTIAVLAGGLHRTYPPSNHALGEAIIKQGGALLSEQPAGEEARRYHFLARNRLISGLADAVVVTEAAARSGTLSTVAHALGQNKEVFAVPGPVTSPLSVGPNDLLRQGASVALSAQDILHVIAPGLKASEQTQIPLASTPEEATVIELLREGVRDGDDLLARSGLAARDYLQTMTMLEIGGTVRPLGANRWTLR